MLLYFAHGSRNYRCSPVVPHTRRGWEFQAVLSGRIRPTFGTDHWGPNTACEGLARRRLWVFPPDCEHGWAGDGRSSRIAVWHFVGVHPSLQRLVGKAGLQSVALRDGDVRALTSWAKQTSAHYPKMTNFTGPIGEAVRAELTLIAMRDTPVQSNLGSAQDPRSEAVQTVARAMAWFDEHMSEAPAVASVADAVAMSETHLRRLFRASGQSSPQRVFATMRADRAEQLLRTTDWKLAVIAEAVGYSGPESFSRAYRFAKGFSPGDVRRELFGKV